MFSAIVRSSPALSVPASVSRRSRTGGLVATSRSGPAQPTVSERNVAHGWRAGMDRRTTSGASAPSHLANTGSVGRAGLDRSAHWVNGSNGRAAVRPHQRPHRAVHPASGRPPADVSGEFGPGRRGGLHLQPHTAGQGPQCPADPQVSVLIFTRGFFGSWVQIDGRAEIVDQPEALDLLVTVYRAIAGEHPDWDEYREAMIRDERVVIRIHPERASGTIV